MTQSDDQLLQSPPLHGIGRLKPMRLADELMFGHSGRVWRAIRKFRGTGSKCPDCRLPCKSFVKLRHGCPGHARESVQVNSPRMFHTQRYASRHRFLRSAEPDIHLLSRTPKSRHRRLSLCSLPVPKQFVESLGSLISFAQSAKCRPGSLRIGSSCLFSGSLQAAAVLRSSAGIKSLCSRSTASR